MSVRLGAREEERGRPRGAQVGGERGSLGSARSGREGRPAGPEPKSSPALRGEGAAPKLPFPILLETSAPRSEVAGGQAWSWAERAGRAGGERPGSAAAVPAGDTALSAQAAGAPGVRGLWGGERWGTGRNSALGRQENHGIQPSVGSGKDSGGSAEINEELGEGVNWKKIAVFSFDFLRVRTTE